MAKDDETLTRHPVPAGVRAVEQQVAEVAGVLADRSLSLDAASTRDTSVALAAAEARLASLRLAVAAHADVVKVGADSGATSTGVWWAVATAAEPPHRRRAGQAGQRAGVPVAPRPDSARGRAMSAEQARVVVRALEDLPDDLPADTVASAEETLVGWRWSTTPTPYGCSGKRILSAVAPEVGEEEDRKKVEAEEKPRPAERQRSDAVLRRPRARPRPVHPADAGGADAGEDPPRVRRPRPRQRHPGCGVLAGRATLGAEDGCRVRAR